MAKQGRAWYCAFGAVYVLETGYPTTTPGEWWFPKRKLRGREGVELFSSTGEAVTAANRNLQRMADEAGLTVAAMRDRLIQQGDSSRGERRIRVGPLSDFGL